jgi:hypothetical protein
MQKPNSHENCVTEERLAGQTAARKSAAAHDKWERQQRFEVIHVDERTTKYKLLKTGERAKQVHKGKIG